MTFKSFIHHLILQIFSELLSYVWHCVKHQGYKVNKTDKIDPETHIQRIFRCTCTDACTVLFQSFLTAVLVFYYKYAKAYLLILLFIDIKYVLYTPSRAYKNNFL